MRNGSNGQQVLTLEEAAKFLRLGPGQVQRLAENGRLPGQEVEGEWRFLKVALGAWLSEAATGKNRLLKWGGVFAGDKDLAEIRSEIYRARGRPETEDETN